MREIANSDLMLTDIPGPEADWSAIAEFALTFNGYNVWGSFEQCAEIAISQRHDSLTDLRTCLFFEQRRWRHFDEDPDEEAMTYIRGVVAKIHNRVSNGNLE